MKRETILTFRANETEEALLSALARAEGKSRSAVIREAVVARAKSLGRREPGHEAPSSTSSDRRGTTPVTT